MRRADRLIQGMAAQGDFRILAAQTTDTVETARICQDLSPVAADALGRALTGAVLLARLLERQFRNQRVTLRIEGNGPLGIVIAEGNTSGETRGFVGNPSPPDAQLDVKRAIGDEGLLTVIRGAGPSGEPYTTRMTLESGGVAQELTRYLALSEQLTSAVLLSVLNRREGVAAAGGIIVQSFPHTTEEKIALMEKCIREAPPLSTLIDRMPIEDAVEQVLQGIDYKPIGPSLNVPVSYTCSCTRERAAAPLALFPRSELIEMMNNDGGSEVVCQYCGRKYSFTREDLLTLSARHEA